MSDLKPCPFCEAALVWSDTYSEYHHPIAKCILSGHKFKKGMIGQWNRRALPAVQPGHVNETPKNEHDTANMLTPDREAALREALAVVIDELRSGPCALEARRFLQSAVGVEILALIATSAHD